MAPPKPVILCVDDEENPLTLRKMVLQKVGYEVITANSVRQALEILSSRQVDLVLSDQLMPGATGTDLAKQLKSDRPHLPVIIVSGVNELPADAVYADRFISKLEGPAYLSQQICEVLVNAQRSA